MAGILGADAGRGFTRGVAAKKKKLRNKFYY
jgi:hypothetical protein